ncbi:hypothetical protein QF043_002463 [Pseudomonas sp. W3I7]|uniref:hypothetical protein n=1 Tax=Pseudomonas sp. W3I7 TaxID=3042292 RepID=UPI0027912669|nr:hypothetical protein [Pseudomonas sp. W3I7]MDQ0703671.1 hypothetical protein [Pseudomonas sp. W3I7]
MAKTVQERSAKTARKRVALAEEELRLRVRPGTRQALADLMEWSGITEQGEAMTLMIYHLHALGPQKCLPLLDPPRHEITVSPPVARKLEQFHISRELRSPGLMLGDDPDDSGVLIPATS